MIYQKTLSAQILERTPKLRQEIQQLDRYAALRENLRQIKVDQIDYYLAEGDLLLDEDELAIYAMEQETKAQTRTLGQVGFADASTSITGIMNNGKVVKWAPDMILTYCVLKSTFSTEKEYKAIRTNMRKATKDWERTCGVRFKHLAYLDNSLSDRPEGVVFPVRGINANGLFIASAFFPTQPKHRWRILIDPTYFTTSYNKVGVLRHELGHVLGLRHEHIHSGAPAACPDELPGDIIKLTDYDPKSVMHYFCGGVGSKTLSISDLDRKGAQKLYGLPFGECEIIGE